MASELLCTMQYAQECERRSTQSIRDGAESKGDEQLPK